MRPLVPTLTLIALLVVAGCVGGPAGGPDRTATEAGTPTGDAAPTQPDHPASVGSESVAAYANGSETYRLHEAALDDGATQVDVTCSATTVGFDDGGGYALVACDGTVYRGDSADHVERVTAYRVTTDGETRIERVSTRDDGSDDERRLRVYNFGDERRSLAVTVAPAGGGTANDSAVYEYRLDGASGAATTGLQLNESVERYDVTVAADGSSRLSTRWTTTGDADGDGPVGVVVVTPDGELVWGTAPA